MKKVSKTVAIPIYVALISGVFLLISNILPRILLRDNSPDTKIEVSGANTGVISYVKHATNVTIHQESLELNTKKSIANPNISVVTENGALVYASYTPLEDGFFKMGPTIGVIMPNTLIDARRCEGGITEIILMGYIFKNKLSSSYLGSSNLTDTTTMFRFAFGASDIFEEEPMTANLSKAVLYPKTQVLVVGKDNVENSIRKIRLSGWIETDKIDGKYRFMNRTRGGFYEWLNDESVAVRISDMLEFGAMSQIYFQIKPYAIDRKRIMDLRIRLMYGSSSIPYDIIPIANDTFTYSISEQSFIMGIDFKGHPTAMELTVFENPENRIGPFYFTFENMQIWKEF